MIQFKDIETTFAHQSNKNLRKTYFLFRMLDFPFVMKTGKFLTNLALKTGIPIEWAIKPTIYSHFVGGETLSQCTETVKSLNKFNVKAILDYSVEGGSSRVDETLAETLASVEFAANVQGIPFVVFKPTAFTSLSVLEKISKKIPLENCETLEAESFKLRMDTICQAAYEKDIPVLIDAEDYAYQNIIDRITIELMKKYNRKKAIVYNTLQMYRTDRLDYLKQITDKAEKEGFYPGFKFVRGAYTEKERALAKKIGYPSPIYPDKQSTDNAFNEALKFAIKNIHRISIFNGTHNEESTQLLADLMKEKNIPHSDQRVWFAQLYGMSDHVSFNLAKDGYNVAKYVPYGPVKSVLPYLIRRAEENTSIAGQTGRELMLISSERKRRKLNKTGKI